MCIYMLKRLVFGITSAKEDPIRIMFNEEEGDIFIKANPCVLASDCSHHQHHIYTTNGNALNTTFQ